MKTAFQSVAILSALSSATLCAQFYSPTALSQSNSITVNGEAEIKVNPDVSIFTLGITTKSPNFVDLKIANDNRIKDLIKIALENNVSKSDIQKDYIDIQPEYKWVTKKEFSGDVQRHEISMYTQRSILVITLKDVSKFESLYSLFIQAPDVEIKDIAFQTSQLKKYRDQARLTAIQAAKDKAIALTGQVEQQIGKAISIQEIKNYWYSPYKSWWNRGDNSQSQMVSYAGNSISNPDGPSLPGSISVKAEISVTFSLK